MEVLHCGRVKRIQCWVPVARPIVPGEGLDAGGVDGGEALAHLTAQLLDERLDQLGNALQPLAQRRNTMGNTLSR